MPAAPAAEEIRRTAAEVLQRADYQLGTSAGSPTAGDSLLLTVLRWLLEAFTALAGSLSFLGVLRYPVAALLCAALAFLIYRMLRTIAGAARRRGPASPTNADRRERGARASQPEEFETLAAAARADGQFIEAVRWLFRAALLRLEQAEQRRPRPGTTNRELVRRYRSTALEAPLRTLVDTLDVHWYGDRPAGPDDLEQCTISYQRVRQIIEERTVGARPVPAKPAS